MNLLKNPYILQVPRMNLITATVTSTLTVIWHNQLWFTVAQKLHGYAWFLKRSLPICSCFTNILGILKFQKGLRCRVSTLFSYCDDSSKGFKFIWEYFSKVNFLDLRAKVFFKQVEPIFFLTCKSLPVLFFLN